ncbi:sensor histidine kinase [Eionea flava]
MNIIQHITSSISLKLFLAFTSIVCLSLIALFLTLNSLEKTREVQHRLTHEALPLLQVSKDLSQSLFTYLTIVESAATSQSTPTSIKIKEQLLIKQQEVQNQLTNLEQHNTTETAAISHMVAQILGASNSLQSLIFEQKPLHLSHIKQQIEYIRQQSTDMRRHIQRYHIIHYADTSINKSRHLSIDKELVHIDEIMSRYHRGATLEEIKYFQSQYTIAIRRITQQVLQIKAISLKEPLAENTNHLLEQISASNGFFAKANALRTHLDETQALVRNNKKIEQEINLLLANLLAQVSKNADTELTKFNTIIKYNINALLLAIFTTIALAWFIFYRYVTPKITHRLKRLSYDTHRISAGDYNIDIDVTGTDEIAQMAHALDGFKHALIAKEKAEKDREKLITQLVNSNEELERFAFVCSHDLQEPLRMIRSFSEKLTTHIGQHLKDDEKGTKYFRFITDGATRAQTLIADILTYSSIDSDAQSLEEVSTEGLIRVIKENMQILLEERQGEITFDPLPAIRGNKTQLFQLFQNLINNGIKYQTPDTIPTVHISVEDKQQYWQFSVKDNGIGIEERHLGKIFDVFQRLHRKNQFAGTGVGLSICKKVVERHGGKLWVTSQKGSGSTFYFTLLKILEEDNNNDQQLKIS